MQIILNLQQNLTQQNHAELQIKNNYTRKPGKMLRLLLQVNVTFNQGIV